MKRWALTVAAGPTNSLLAQNGGHDVVHAAHRMHFVPSSYRARSSGLCKRSVSGGAESLIRYGAMERYFSKNGSRSTTRSLMTVKPSIGSIVTCPGRSLTSSLHASRLRPLMRIASDPHTPCAQLRRYVSVPSWRHL